MLCSFFPFSCFDHERPPHQFLFARKKRSIKVGGADHRETIAAKQEQKHALTSVVRLGDLMAVSGTQFSCDSDMET